jgi:hypothetical protein
LKKSTKKLVLLALVLGAGVAIAVTVGATSSARTSDVGSHQKPVRFELTLPRGTDVRSVGYIVRSAGDEPIASGSIPVARAEGAVTADVTLPPGSKDSVTFIANPVASSPTISSLIATQTFDVSPQGPNRVEVGASRFAPLAAGAGASPGGGPGAVSSPTSASAPSCQACQLASDEGRCDPELLAATWNTDPNHDHPRWGCDTLAPGPQKAACAALLHCLTTTRCAQGDSPVAKCYCGAASAVPCFAGDGIDGPCISYYRAAAVASTGGPGPTASDAELSRFVTTYASNPTTPIGLADNLNECALAAHCNVCDAL